MTDFDQFFKKKFWHSHFLKEFLDRLFERFDRFFGQIFWKNFWHNFWNPISGLALMSVVLVRCWEKWDALQEYVPFAVLWITSLVLLCYAKRNSQNKRYWWTILGAAVPIGAITLGTADFLDKFFVRFFGQIFWQIFWQIFLTDFLDRFFDRFLEIIMSDFLDRFFDMHLLAKSWAVCVCTTYVMNSSKIC